MGDGRPTRGLGAGGPLTGMGVPSSRGWGEPEKDPTQETPSPVMLEDHAGNKDTALTGGRRSRSRHREA